MNLPPNATPPYGAYGLSPAAKSLLKFAQSRKTTWLGRRLALMARRLVLNGRTQPVDACAEGFRLRAHISDNVSERKYLFMPKFVDPVERAYVVEHLTPDGVFLDIGANAGVYTLTAAHAYATKGGAGYVLAVEANPTMQGRLEYNVALNDLTDHIRLAPLALSDRDGEVAFSISNNNLGESGLLPVEGEAIRVPCRTLVGLLNEHAIHSVDGMKIDVEGMEDVILGHFFSHAPSTLFPKFIIIENSAHKWKIDLFGLLKRMGYFVVAHEKMNSILVLQNPKNE